MNNLNIAFEVIHTAVRSKCRYIAGHRSVNNSDDKRRPRETHCTMPSTELTGNEFCLRCPLVYPGHVDYSIPHRIRDPPPCSFVQANGLLHGLLLSLGTLFTRMRSSVKKDNPDNTDGLYTLPHRCGKTKHLSLPPPSKHMPDYILPKVDIFPGDKETSCQGQSSRTRRLCCSTVYVNPLKPCYPHT
jgi:hypothetical protein